MDKKNNNIKIKKDKKYFENLLKELKKTENIRRQIWQSRGYSF
jgi:hypothetical protein